MGILLLLTLFLPHSGISSDTLRIDFLDVGEGDAIFLSHKGHCTFLIDTGNPLAGAKILAHLTTLGITRLDHLILTHPHLDHIGGVFTLASLLSVSRFYDNGEDLSPLSKPGGIGRWYKKLVRDSSHYTALRAGHVIKCFPLSVRVLWPPRAGLTKDWNTNSLVLMATFGRLRCLLMGDANRETERRLLKTHINLKAQILKIGHHGACDSGTPSFLAAVSPQVVILSVDAENIHGYPAAETLVRLRHTGARILRTDQNGTITIYAHTEGDIKIITEKP